MIGSGESSLGRYHLSLNLNGKKPICQPPWEVFPPADQWLRNANGLVLGTRGREGGVAIRVISVNVDFLARNISRNIKKSHFTITKGSIHQEDIIM